MTFIRKIAAGYDLKDSSFMVQLLISVKLRSYLVLCMLHSLRSKGPFSQLQRGGLSLMISPEERTIPVALYIYGGGTEEGLKSWQDHFTKLLGQLPPVPSHDWELIPAIQYIPPTLHQCRLVHYGRVG